MKKSIQITSIICLILGFSDSSIGQTHPDLSKRKKEQSFEIPQLGIMFRYLPEYDELPAHQSADLNTWRQINIDQFGITFKSPTIYKSSWKKKHSHSYIEPTDSVFELDYGSGVTVQFYESKNKFYEIAFAEDFKQYHKGDTYPFPDGRWDTITRPIYDSSWIMIGLSGMWPKAHFLDGKDWKGLRCKSDTRGYYKSDSMSYSYSDEC